MAFLATIDTSPRPELMKFPVFSQLAGNWGLETGSLETRPDQIFVPVE